MKKPQSTSRILLSSTAGRARELRGRFLLAVGSAFLLLLGLTGHRGATPANLSAVLMTTGGCVGLVWCGIQTLRDWQLQTLSEAEAGRRYATKLARRQRTAQQKSARTLEQQQNAAREAAFLKLREKEHLEHVRQRELEAQFRRCREKELVREAQRIASIPESEMHLALIRIWKLRGWQLVSRQPIPETEGTLRTEELLMINGFGQREVIIFLIDGSRAGVSEIEMADRQRIDANAQTVCLLSLTGFTPQAVRSAPRFQLTLVEPHLLAQWSLTSASNMAELKPEKAEQNS